ncbi:MAG TPA: serine hydroxymethyltransferase [Bacilli bacterium]|nr:serine hydroxymethyltransferase [Bacilli bacterium]HQA55610.1 serine hydroxymethyltransferase [Bacilli bacterium]
MDKDIELLINEETLRQNIGIELIASENYADQEVRNACSSILTNKYAEGYPGHRYYGGCEVVDKVESLAIERACQLFDVKFANVQPHSGSQANAAAYRALLPEGGKILSLVLNDGGHLTHGSPVSFSSHFYNFVFYPLDKQGKLNYDDIRRITLEEKPDLILTGYSAYPYAIDFKKFREIADEVGCYFMVDMAHIAGLVAGGAHMNPCPYADIVTSTTHKTLRGPRGGLILTNSEELIKRINSAIFPFYQGGPLEHIIAAKAICFKQASTEEFKKYAHDVVINTKFCQEEFQRLGALVSGTDNHLFLLNVLDTYGINGLEAQKKLEAINVTTNKNMIPNDTLKPNKTSGLRIGFAATTTRGCTKEDAKAIALLIHEFLSNKIGEVEAKARVAKIISHWKLIENI